MNGRHILMVNVKTLIKKSWFSKQIILLIHGAMVQLLDPTVTDSDLFRSMEVYFAVL